MSSARHRILFGLSAAIFGAALFLFASAYVVDHGYGKISAAVLGALAFPVVPVGWQLWGEHRRKVKLAAAKMPPKSSLAASDRYWMRFVMVAVVALGPLFYFSHTGVLGSVWRQGLWFVPTTPRDLAAESEQMLRRVPSDAELVIVGHKVADEKSPGGSAVVAWGNRQVMAVVDHAILDDKDGKPEDKLKEMNDGLKKAPFLPVEPVSLVSDGSLFVVASDAWKMKVELAGTGPSEEIRAELARAPKDAQMVAAFAPKTKVSLKDLDPDMIKHGVVWVVVGDEKLVIEGRVELKDAAAATKLVGDLGDALHGKTDDLPKSCKEPVGKLVENLKLETNGAVATARLEVKNDALMGVMFCAMGELK